MNIALLLDEGLPLRTAAARSKGLDVTHVREVGLASAPDHAILEFARRKGQVCITLDPDFDLLLADAGATQPSVIFVREPKLNYLDAAELIARLVAQLGTELIDGLAVTANRQNVRLRRLPLKAV